MNLFQLNRNIRSIRRYRQIVRVLFKYGFDNLLSYLNLTQLVARWRRMLRRETSAFVELSQAERMRLALEELGPTFVKLGQFLSTRSDLIPPNYLEEFAKLQDNVPPFTFDEVTAEIRREFGKEITELFSFFSEESLAAASIAQVHRAILLSGEDVVVKIRRPGIISQIETDIEALMLLALMAEKHLPDSEIYDPVGQVRELARTIRREMDLSLEGRTIERFATNFSGDNTVYFPKVYWEMTSQAVLTMEMIKGLKVSDIEHLEAGGYDLKLIAKRGADAFVKMVLHHGFFHGDLHPGNVLILPGNVICMLDFGMTGRIDPFLKRHLTDIVLAILKRDAEEVISLLVYSGDITDNVNVRSLRRDISDFIDTYYELALQDLQIGKLLVDFTDIITAYRIKFHPDLLLLAKTFMSMESIGRRLDPKFDMTMHLRPMMEKEIRERLSPKSSLKDLFGNANAYVNLIRSLPKDIKEILNRINRDKFKIDLEHRGLDRFIKELDKSINRLSSSLIIAALIVGSSIVMQTGKGPLLLGFPVFAFMGYSIAGIISLVWLIAIIRSGRL
ncbi:MAG: phosphotransferase [Geobacteraceae bacterium]|nr:phosphotransferase [Geobacteraceae bacterium]